MRKSPGILFGSSNHAVVFEDSAAGNPKARRAGDNFILWLEDDLTFFPYERSLRVYKKNLST